MSPIIELCSVIPAKAGIQFFDFTMDSRLRGDDDHTLKVYGPERILL